MSKTFAVTCLLLFCPMAGAGQGEWAVFESSKIGLKFRYPAPLLTVSGQEGSVSLVHSVPYRHEDFCRLEEDAYLSVVVDFDVSLTVLPTNLPEAFRQLQSDFIASRFLKDDQIETSPGFIDCVQIGSFRGYRVTEGVEGCGFRRFYFGIDEKRTMVVTWTKVGELSAVCRYRDEVLAVPGVIDEGQAAKLFDGVISSCTPVD
jgi:hypothetical protein